VIITGLAFLQNLRRGHYEVATDLPAPLLITAAFHELARAVQPSRPPGSTMPGKP
jgi:hypothetical protein